MIINFNLKYNTELLTLIYQNNNLTKLNLKCLVKLKHLYYKNNQIPMSNLINNN